MGNELETCCGMARKKSRKHLNNNENYQNANESQNSSIKKRTDDDSSIFNNTSDKKNQYETSQLPQWQTTSLLAQIAKGVELMHQGKQYIRESEFDLALQLLYQALNIFEAFLPPKHANTLQVLSHLAQVFLIQAEHQASKMIYENILHVYEDQMTNKSNKDDNNDQNNNICECLLNCVIVLNNLAIIYTQLNVFDKAEACFKSAAVKQQQLNNQLKDINFIQKKNESDLQFHLTYVHTALCLNEGILSHLSLNDIEATEKHLKLALNLIQSNQDSHSFKMHYLMRKDNSFLQKLKLQQAAANMINSLCKMTQTKFAEALLQLESAFEIYLQVFFRVANSSEMEVQNLYFAMVQGNLGGLKLQLRQYDAAKLNFQKCLLMYSVFFGERHAMVADTLHNLGLFCLEIKQYQKAKEYFKKAAKLQKQVFTDVLVNVDLNQQLHFGLIATYEQLSRVHYRMEEYQPALKFAKISLEVKHQFYSDGSMEVIDSFYQIGIMSALLSDTQQGIYFFTQALKYLDKIDINNNNIINNGNNTVNGNGIRKKQIISAQKGKENDNIIISPFKKYENQLLQNEGMLVKEYRAFIFYNMAVLQKLQGKLAKSQVNIEQAYFEMLQLVKAGQLKNTFEFNNQVKTTYKQSKVAQINSSTK